MATIEAVIGNYTTFLDAIFKELEAIRIETASFECDHICYRVDTSEKYLIKKAQLLEHAELLSEAMIAGRLICTFLLHVPLQHKDRKIRMVELPNFKQGSPYPEGLEHVEFVIGEHRDFTTFMQQYPHVKFDTRAMKKIRNADVSVQLGDRFTVKFHHFPLDVVIAEELQEEIIERQKRDGK